MDVETTRPTHASRDFGPTSQFEDVETPTNIPSTTTTTTPTETTGVEEQEQPQQQHPHRRRGSKVWVRKGQQQQQKDFSRPIDSGDVFRSITGIFTGLALGVVLEKSKVYLPYIIREQFLVHNFTLLKMFLAAIISGTVAVSLIDALSGGRVKRRGSVTAAATAPLAELHAPSRREVRAAMFKNYDGNVVGGILLGIGIALAGSLPGAVWLQIGAGVDKSFWVVAGAMLGIFIYGSMERQGFSITGRRNVPTGYNRGFQMSAGMSLLFAGFLSVILYFLEKAYPWQQEIIPVLNAPKGFLLPQLFMGNFRLSDYAWGPIEAGLIAGLLQVPVYFWSRRAAVGKSSNYLSTLTFFLYGIDPKANVGEGFFEEGGVQQRAQQYKRNIPNSDFWNVAFVFGILIGAYVSNWLSGNSAMLTNPVTRPEAFLGGLLLLLGARIASQNAKIHMTNNVMEISLATLFTLVPMFGTAMLTANLLW